MKNILYIGPYRDNTSFGQSSKRLVNALITNTKINLAIRPVFYTRINENRPLEQKTYTEFEENSFKYYDAVIQHGCPDMFEYHGDFGKNIGLCPIETRGLYGSGWIEKMNLMDEIIVTSLFSLDSLMATKIKAPVRILPEPYNLKQYQDPKQPFFTYKEEDKPFIFYTIGRYTEKKNIKNIILAFILEFNQQDNVKLFIKCGDQTDNNEDLQKVIEYDIENMKKIARKNQIPDIDVVCGYLEDNDIVRLHQSADCYINAVRSDCFGPNSIEAALCNKLVINTKNIGSNTYFNSKNAFMVESDLARIYSSNYFDRNTFTINEYWYEPDLVSIRDAMRQAYEVDSVVKQEKLEMFDKSIFDKNIIGRSLI